MQNLYKDCAVKSGCLIIRLSGKLTQNHLTGISFFLLLGCTFSLNTQIYNLQWYVFILPKKRVDEDL